MPNRKNNGLTSLFAFNLLMTTVLETTLPIFLGVNNASCAILQLYHTSKTSHVALPGGWWGGGGALQRRAQCYHRCSNGNVNNNIALMNPALCSDQELKPGYLQVQGHVCKWKCGLAQRLVGRSVLVVVKGRKQAWCSLLHASEPHMGKRDCGCDVIGWHWLLRSVSLPWRGG